MFQVVIFSRIDTRVSLSVGRLESMRHTVIMELEEGGAVSWYVHSTVSITLALTLTLCHTWWCSVTQFYQNLLPTLPYSLTPKFPTCLYVAMRPWQVGCCSVVAATWGRWYGGHGATNYEVLLAVYGKGLANISGLYNRWVGGTEGGILVMMG